MNCEFKIITALLISSVTAQAANFFEDLISQTVAQPLIENASQFAITPAIGYGTYSNSFGAQGVDVLKHTNANFYIIGLDINGYSSHIFIPFKDSDSQIKSTLDSDVFRFQANLKLNSHLTIDGSYTKVIGFYKGTPEIPEDPVVKFPGLGLKKYSLMATYVSDETHRSSLFTPIAYRPVETGRSPFFGFELAQHELFGLQVLNLQIKPSDQVTDPVLSAQALTALASAGWSQSKMYEQFFWSYAIGIGLGASYLDKQYAVKKSNEAVIATTVPFSGVLGWNRKAFTTGFFGLVRSWGAKLDNLDLSNSNGNTGLFMAYQF